MPEIDFAHGEARGFEVEIELDRGEIAQNLAQELIVPARGLRQSIVGNAEGARLICGQVLKPDNWNVRKPNRRAAWIRPWPATTLLS